MDAVLPPSQMVFLKMKELWNRIQDNKVEFFQILTFPDNDFLLNQIIVLGKQDQMVWLYHNYFRKKGMHSKYPHKTAEFKNSCKTAHSRSTPNRHSTDRQTDTTQTDKQTQTTNRHNMNRQIGTAQTNTNKAKNTNTYSNTKTSRKIQMLFENLHIFEKRTFAGMISLEVPHSQVKFNIDCNESQNQQHFLFTVSQEIASENLLFEGIFLLVASIILRLFRSLSDKCEQCFLSNCT